MVYRQRRDAEWNEMIASRNVEPEKVEDWMGKFSEKNVELPDSPSAPEMDANAFKMAFKMRSKSKPELSKPSGEIMDAAKTVFDHHDEKADYDAIDSLTKDLLETSEPHEANAVLSPSKSVQTRTVRHARKNPKGNNGSSENDLDLDL